MCTKSHKRSFVIISNVSVRRFTVNFTAPAGSWNSKIKIKDT